MFCCVSTLTHSFAGRLVKRLIDANAPRGANGKLRCNLCSVTMPSPQVAQTHFSGKKHQRKLEALKTAEETMQEVLTDTPLDVTAPGKLVALYVDFVEKFVH